MRAVVIVALVVSGAACGTAGTTSPHEVEVRAPRPAVTTTVPVEDPARHDNTVINKTIHDLNTTTTTPRTLPRTQ